MHIRSKNIIRVETMEASKEAIEEDTIEEEVDDTVGEEVDNLHASIVVIWATCRGSIPSPMHCVYIATMQTVS
jgi:hypothetical protein